MHTNEHLHQDLELRQSAMTISYQLFRVVFQKQKDPEI